MNGDERKKDTHDQDTPYGHVEYYRPGKIRAIAWQYLSYRRGSQKPRFSHDTDADLIVAFVGHKYDMWLGTGSGGLQ